MVTHLIVDDSDLSATVDATVHELRSGAIVAIPTDTTYAFLAEDRQTGASDRLFNLTKRQRTFELTLLVADQTQAASVSMGVTPQATRLMEKFWPGTLSLVLPRNVGFEADLGSDDETVGVRCPGHVFARLVCERLGPVASVSAAMHGEAGLNTAEEVVASFGDHLALVVDGGPTPGLSATAVDATGPDVKLLREGAIAWRDISSVLD